MKVTAVTCSHCGNTIYSRAIHDFRTCTCGETFIDGGPEYVRTNASETETVRVNCTKENLYKDYNLGINKYGIIIKRRKRKEVK